MSDRAYKAIGLLMVTGISAFVLFFLFALSVGLWRAVWS